MFDHYDILTIQEDFALKVFLNLAFLFQSTLVWNKSF